MLVKFSDGSVVEVSIDIEAPLEVVWSLVSDINLPAQFQGEFQSAEWVDDGPALGAEFRGKNERNGRQWETSSWVSEYTPNAAFGWAVQDRDNPGATWVFRLAPTATGTQLTFHRRLGPGPSGITAIIAKNPANEEEIIAFRNAEQTANMQAVIEGIKTLAE